MSLELAKLTDQLGAIKSDVKDRTRDQQELDRQAQEAEAMLQSSPEVTPPTLLNYKSSFEGLRKKHELLKIALANKRAVESRLLEAEANQNKLAKELSLSQILLNQERVNRGASQHKERQLATQLEQEKQNRDAANRSLHEFLNQPEINDALMQFQAQKKSKEVAVTLPAIQLHENIQPLPSAPEKSSFIPGR